ncbi:hypothetical protein DXG01_010305 [Tephrocybe rancida]|nr:hypothetical protein DXG01_010305 [Tephrocybe rancida]
MATKPHQTCAKTCPTHHATMAATVAITVVTEDEPSLDNEPFATNMKIGPPDHSKKLIKKAGSGDTGPSP